MSIGITEKNKVSIQLVCLRLLETNKKKRQLRFLSLKDVYTSHFTKFYLVWPPNEFLFLAYRRFIRLYLKITSKNLEEVKTFVFYKLQPTKYYAWIVLIAVIFACTFKSSSFVKDLLAKYLKSNVLQKLLHGEMAVCYKLKHSKGHSKHLNFNINLAIYGNLKCRLTISLFLLWLLAMKYNSMLNEGLYIQP